MSGVPLLTACFTSLMLTGGYGLWIILELILKTSQNQNSRILLIFAIERWQFWKLQNCQLSFLLKTTFKSKVQVLKLFLGVYRWEDIVPFIKQFESLGDAGLDSRARGAAMENPSCLIIWWIYLWDMIGYVPSGKRLHSYGKSPCYLWVNQRFLWPFSIVFLYVYQIVNSVLQPATIGHIPWPQRPPPAVPTAPILFWFARFFFFFFFCLIDASMTVMSNVHRWYIGSMVLLYMVCHGSHQYTPFMLYTSTMDPSWGIVPPIESIILNYIVLMCLK